MATATKTRAVSKEVRPPRLAAKEAVAIAMGAFQDLFPDAAKADKMLEEIEQSQDKKFWLITVGYNVKGTFRETIYGAQVRAYKLFTIDQTTGEVVSVKIRPI